MTNLPMSEVAAPPKGELESPVSATVGDGAQTLPASVWSAAVAPLTPRTRPWLTELTLMGADLPALSAAMGLRRRRL